jgi:preprotein translocase subunit YajC
LAGPFDWLDQDNSIRTRETDVNTLSLNVSSLALFAQDALGGGLMQLLFPFLAIGILFYFLLIRPQKAEQNRRLAMLAEVKKNDHIITTGGIYGVVTNVQRDDDEITIKVDESTNTKLRVSLAAIAKVLVDDPSGDASKK